MSFSRLFQYPLEKCLTSQGKIMIWTLFPLQAVAKVPKLRLTISNFLHIILKHGLVMLIMSQVQTLMRSLKIQKDGQGQTPHIIHTGRQELHIVLHPIPIGDPHSAANGQALHFVPVHLNSNQTASGQYPFMFPVAPKTSESHEKQSSPPEGYDEEYYPSNNNSDRIDLRKHRHEDSSASSSSETTDGKHSSRVTWVLRQENQTQ
ncbi:hypothetical protein CEXT_227391 [Caerostris extrusa]|uniref:Uncharacterized protein n=1 Tax=Caerostris extrusa TaxID=172846 RepID=A0AAV4NTL5_CAEEX|nr:hypothetical protein CEXT_227391 [Caerostris extrusa]